MPRLFAGTFLTLALLATAALSVVAAEAKGASNPAESGTVSGTYSATLEFKGAATAEGKSPPAFTFSGKVLGSGSKFRLELNNGMTQEQQIYLVDGASKKAWMLFPDTLNGISSDLARFDQGGVLQNAQQFAGGSSGVPKDWTKTETKTETLNGRSVTHVTYTLPKRQDGTGRTGKVHLWQTANATPVRVMYDSATMKLTVNFDEFKRGLKLDSTLFTPDKKYKIRPLAAGEAPPMPGGFGGAMGGKAKGAHS
jgi:hypothetical protein